MASYTIGPLDQTDWRIDPENFAEQLKNQWPDVEIQLVSNPVGPYLMHWQLNLGGYPFQGGVVRSRLRIHMEGFLPNIMEFILWYRKITPQWQKLFLYDEGCNDQIELLPNITEDEIMDAFYRS